MINLYRWTHDSVLYQYTDPMDAAEAYDMARRDLDIRGFHRDTHFANIPYATLSGDPHPQRGYWGWGVEHG